MWILAEIDDLYGDIQIISPDGAKEKLKTIEKKHIFDVFHSVATAERSQKPKKDITLKIIDISALLGMLKPSMTNSLVSKAFNK
jgi:hypothetical protein